MGSTLRRNAFLAACAGASWGAASCTDGHDRTPQRPSATAASAVFVADSPETRARIDEVRTRFVLPAARSVRTGKSTAPRQVLGAGVAARFERTGDGHVRPLVSRKNAALTPASVAIAERASGDAFLEDDRTHVAVQFRLRGASDVAVSVSGGFALYPGALDGHDVVHRPRADGTEDFVVFETRPAVEELAYDVDVSRAAGLRLVSNTLEFLDDSGAPRLRVAPPYLVDAAGSMRYASLAVTGCAYDVDPAGPWGRPVTAPGAASCTVHVAWHSDVYPAIIDPAWTTTGSLITGRSDHTATLLNSGKVLFAGGMGLPGTVKSAELFDGTSSFAATGSMALDREAHTATLLPSGKVLVAGGFSMTLPGVTSAAELFDGTGTFAATGAMKATRQAHAATLLASGKVLITGGDDSTGNIFPTAELYNGTTSFAYTGTMTTTRTGHASIRLASPSTKVLIAGGMDVLGNQLGSAELFDGTSTFAPTGSMPETHYYRIQTALLPSNKVLVTGGGGGNATKAAALFDGVSTFAPTGTLLTARNDFTATLFGSGKVLVAGGDDGTNTGTYMASAEMYDGTTSFSPASSMNAPRGAHTATLLQSGRVLVAGGNDGSMNWLQSAELFGSVAAGGVCTYPTDCTSGVCEDGICCAGACSGTCMTCTAGTGACVAVKNAPDPDTCTVTQSCDGAGACKLVNGQPSGTAANCASGFVSDGVCCNTACASACDACSTAAGASVNGTCATLAQGAPGNPACGTGYVCDGTHVTCPTPCVGDVDCAAGYYCAANGTCTAQKTQGATCNVAAAADCKVAGCRACSTGNCVDGVCCDTACTAVCNACAAALKESGPDGTCGPVAFEKPPPRSSCPTSAPNSCGPDGTCNGAGACAAFAPPGASCGPTSCSAGSVSGAICNGTGACTQGSSASCAPYGCNGAVCGTTCSGDGDCASTAFCSAAGACVPKAAKGAACGSSSQCASGFCVDGFCCTSACTGQCEACDVAGASGTCTAVSGVPHGARAACGSDGTTCGGSCNGANRATCTYHDGTSCGSSCANGQGTDMICTTQGTCTANPPKACPGNVVACDGTSCKASCTADSDCAQGFGCATGKCLPLSAATCDGAHTVKAPNGTVTDCTPYDCEGDHCKTSCVSINDCVAGNVCDTDGHCVPLPSSPDAPSGCSATPSSRSPGGAFGVAFALVLGALRRARRRELSR